MPASVSKRKSPNAKPGYRPCVVSFIDILGFRSFISTMTCEDILKVVEKFQRFAGSKDPGNLVPSKGSNEFNWTRCVFFSDSVVRFRPIDASYSEGSLFAEIINLLHAQAELAAQGVFIRGGLTVGDLYSAKDVVFGPAMVRAYELESSFANFPRIVIDPIVFQKLHEESRLRASHHSVKDEIEHIKKLVRICDDGLPYIDYFGAFSNELDDISQLPDYLNSVRTHIIANYKEFKCNFSVLSKYLWLAKYLNRTARRFKLDTTDWDIVLNENDIPEIYLLD